MGTSLSQVFDLFSMLTTDYRLDNLFKSSIDSYENYIEGWLIFAINDFYICDQSLTYNSETKEFDVTLTSNNMVVLATLMMKYWLQKCVNDVSQFSLHIKDRDFQISSESQNFREKNSALRQVSEQCSQLLQDYAYQRVDWGSWYAQDFSGGF